jgi:hypothetical protein
MTRVNSPNPSAAAHVSFASEFAGDPEAQMAATLLEHGHSTRASTRAARDAAEQQLQHHEHAQVSKMRSQAKAMLVGAIGGGALQVASGALTLAAASSHSRATEATYKGAAASADGAGKAFSGAASAEVTRLEAGATEAGHRAGACERKLDSINARMDEARDLIRTALDFMKSSQEKASDTNRAALFSRV